MTERRLFPALLVVLLAGFFQAAQAQPGFRVDIKKDKPYTERKLKAEKTGDGQLKAPRRIFQNLTTHYNYYFNANNKFNEILERAKAQHRDDYSALLSFYPYSLDATAADSAQLDSVIYKCRTGIVSHDLRSEWGDELYLLWGASWHLQKKLDSASMMLQFINYAYAPQQEFGFYSYIGTHKDGAQELSIATKEDKKFLHSNTFARNNAFLWQARTLTEMGKYALAGSLITTLKRDPVFPERLHNDLEEAEAYWYYRQGRWDSAAAYLGKALDGADSRKEKARWEYLVAQLLEQSGKPDEATAYYERAIAHTPDPVMEVYARLNLVRLNREGGEGAIDRNIAELLKMARRDKYEDYRDIIYYMAARMEMERNNTDAALELLARGAKYNNGNAAARSAAFLRLADASFAQKRYLQAAAFYDSVQTADLAPEEVQRVENRRGPLHAVAENDAVIARQDSLQRIAAMPKEQQEEFIKKLVKRLRKEQGLKDEPATSGGNGLVSNQPADLFSSAKGEWYFYNSNSRTQGRNEFKQVWGNRPNVDNWRRYAVVSQQLMARDQRTNTDPGNVASADAGAVELTVEGLTARLPVTPEAIRVSNDSIRGALTTLGSVYLNQLEDYPSSAAAFEELRRRFPDAALGDEALFNLHFAYTKAGNPTAAAQARRQLLEKYPQSRYAAILTTGRDPMDKKTASPEATKAYEGVYDLFIEGKFDEALAAKRAADSTYKTTFWQPQLLYIEAVYYAKQREDSMAKTALQTIVRQNTHPGLTAKAENLLSVLSRRKEIEDELNRYEIQNKPEEPAPATDTAVVRPTVTAVTPAKKDTAVVKPVVKKDSVAAKPLVIPKAVDTVAKKPVTKLADTVARKPVVKPQPDTVAKQPVVKSARDTVARKPVVRPADTLSRKPVVKKPVIDTLVRKAAPPKPASLYTYAADVPHYAVVILDRVDPVFVNEARNAFFRYNREKFSSQPLDAQLLTLTADVRLLLISGFANAQAATEYAQRAKTLAPTEIIPWLTSNKYTFTIISAPNLEALKGTSDINAYKKFLEQYLPGKF